MVEQQKMNLGVVKWLFEYQADLFEKVLSFSSAFEMLRLGLERESPSSIVKALYL